MPSQLKSDTARANGAKSHGPKSAETRETSPHNSLRHGFTARHIILLECKNGDQFKKMEDEFAAMHQPATLAEQDLVDEMVAARWRIQRIRAIETVILDCDLATVKEFMGDAAHPGKDRTKGHFGFAGHSDPVAFRNIQIKLL